MAENKWIRAAAFACILVPFMQGTLSINCTDENVARCTQPLDQFNVSDGSLVPSYPIEEMVMICKTYREVKACMGQFEHTCYPVDQRWFKGVHDSYKFLCEDNFDEYKQYRDCLATPQLHAEGQSCNISLHFSLSGASYSEGSAKYKAERMCQYARQYLSCVEHLVDSFCGEKAAAWQRGYDEASLTPIMSYIGCQLSKSSYERTAIITGVILTFILVVVFIGVGICLWMYAKKKNKRMARERQVARQDAGRGRDQAVYRVGAPGSEGQVNLTPYAFSTPSPVPPPYAEKPPAYGDQDNSFTGVNGFPPGMNHYGANNGHLAEAGATAAAAAPNNYSSDPPKMPLPPDYEALERPLDSHAAGQPRVTPPTDSDYLVLQVPPTSTSGQEGLYEEIASSRGGGYEPRPRPRTGSPEGRSERSMSPGSLNSNSNNNNENDAHSSI